MSKIDRRIRTRVLSLVQAQSATLEFRKDSGRRASGPVSELEHEIELTAPTGKVWSASRSHTYVLRCSAIDLLYQEALEVVEMGVTACEQEHCDFCDPEN